ncbi:MAG: elongation factor P [Parcubacteria group bacterium]|nr:elongation factor P [Parcubacteria group bacterium]
MSTISYSEVTQGKNIIIDGQPYEVLTSHVARTQQRKPTNQVKARNLISGKLSDLTFRAADKVEEAEIDTKEIKFLYTNKGEYWFCESNDPGKRFKLEELVLGTQVKFLKTNSVIEAIVFDEKTIGIKMPIKVDLKVTEAHPAVKGDTAKGGNKQVVLETGATISVPMFVKEGDILRINTETGEYTDRLGSNF